MRRGHQRIHRQNAKRWRSIEDYVVIIFQDRRQGVFQFERRIELSRQHLLQFCKCQPARPQKQQRILRWSDDRGQSNAGVTQNIEHTRGDLAGIIKSNCRICLRIEVNQQGSLAAMRQRRGQIDRRRGLPDAAFLIRNRDDGRHLFVPPPARKESSRSDPATGFLYMGAASRKPPRPRLTVRSQAVHWQGKSGRIGVPWWKTRSRSKRQGWRAIGRPANSNEGPVPRTAQTEELPHVLHTVYVIFCSKQNSTQLTLSHLWSCFLLSILYNSAPAPSSFLGARRSSWKCVHPSGVSLADIRSKQPCNCAFGNPARPS